VKPDPLTGKTCAETVGDACEKHISLDSDACEAVAGAATVSVIADKEIDGDAEVALECESAHAQSFLHYAEFTAVTKMLSNDCAMLARGTVYPIHTHYDIAETGRTTSSKPALQNLNTGRVKNDKSTAQRLRKGVRQAFIPRPGKVFIQADYPQLELYTLAQTCIRWLGFSKLGEMLNAGMDPHLAFAATLRGMTYEDAAKNKKRDDVDKARQIGKVFNFGKPGGMGNLKLQKWARKTYGVNLTLEQLKEYTETWHATFPEMRAHFAVFMEFEGDQIRARRDYDCFEPFESCNAS